MDIKEQFINWINKKGIYKGVNKLTFVDRYLNFLDFNPFIIEDDFSNIDEIKSKLKTQDKNLKTTNDEFINFNNKSQNGAPSAIMGSENFFKFLDELKALKEINNFTPYFNLSGIDDYKNVAGITYNKNLAEADWFYDTRKKLYHLINLLGEKIGDNFELVYTEQPNGQGGRSKIVFKDYILAGFAPQNNIGDDLFIKVFFSGFKKTPHFGIDLDMNYRKGTSRFNSQRNKINTESIIEWEIDENFPDNWNDLLKLITPKVVELSQKIKLMLQNSSNASNMQIKSLNQILYGPPGTGKTYNTINKAIEIINPTIDFTQEREDIKKEFDRLHNEGQIVFTTFHQSMSYEDFIEGIKPLTKNEKVIYANVDGIFKVLVKNAMIEYIRQDLIKENENDFDALYDDFIEIIKPFEGKREGLFTTKTGVEIMLVKASEESILVKYVWTDNKKQAEGQHTFSVTKEKLKRVLVEGIDPSKIKSLKTELHPLVGHIHCELFAVYKKFYDFIIENKGEIDAVHFDNEDLTYKEVKEQFDQLTNDQIKGKYVKPYVLIIDEINRGNVSQIFGELITLIEESKRLGNDEALEVTLPYSKDTFGVPPNLYIIGTMNTADRSVEALDTALRRRFSFEEMMPQTELLTPSALYCKLLWEYKDVRWEDKEFKEKEDKLFLLLGVSDELKNERKKIWDDHMFEKINNDFTHFDHFQYTGINLKVLLETINKRIELLLDRDHTIGHSYFINVTSLEDLENTFKNNIIPLLQEYFYNDYEKIALILGEGFVEIKKPQDNQVKFAKLSVGVEQPEIQTVFSIREKGFNIQNAIISLLG